MEFDWTTFWFVLIIGILVLLLILVIAWYSSLRKRKREMPSHVELYFGENFRKIMDEWDFTNRDRVKEFKKDMSRRLTKVGRDITTLEKRKSSLESRMKAVEKGMESLEVL